MVSASRSHSSEALFLFVPQECSFKLAQVECCTTWNVELPETEQIRNETNRN